MSEIMTQCIIGMPYDLAMGDELSRRQFHSRAQELLADYAALESELAKLRAGQEPVAVVDKHVPSAEIQWTERGEELCLPHGTKLYTAPAAELAKLRMIQSDLVAARLQTAMMVVCAKNLADERNALLTTIELMQSKQELIGYTMRSSLKPLMDDTMPDGKHIRIGVDHRVCWEDDTPYDNLIPLYVIGDV